jgi:crotonobetaine/carnitine-CoA ligase
MARFMIPRYIEFIDGLPKTTTQKISKKPLKERGVGPSTWDREGHGSK